MTFLPCDIMIYCAAFWVVNNIYTLDLLMIDNSESDIGTDVDLMIDNS